METDNKIGINPCVPFPYLHIMSWASNLSFELDSSRSETGYLCVFDTAVTIKYLDKSMDVLIY